MVINNAAWSLLHPGPGPSCANLSNLSSSSGAEGPGEAGRRLIKLQELKIKFDMIL